MVNIIHIFPYSARTSGGHSNAIHAFITSQRNAGLNAVGLTPITEREDEGDVPLGFPFLEVESLGKLRWKTISQHFAFPAGTVIFNFHSISRSLRPLICELRAAGIPYVFTSHGQLGIQTFARWLKKFIYLNFLDRGIRGAAGIQVLASSVARRLKYLLPGYHGNILVQGNLLDTPNSAIVRATCRADFNIPNGALLLLYLGRIDVPIKGLDIVVKAFSKLEPGKFTLVFAGPDWEGGKEHLENLAGKLGCRKGLHFTGPVYGERKWALLRLADVFLFPSRREAFGLAMAEAMACEAPVITSNTICLAADLQEADAAEVLQMNAENLASRITNFSTDESRRKTVGRNGRNWVLNYCDNERAGERFREFYEAILARATRPL